MIRRLRILSISFLCCLSLSPVFAKVIEVSYPGNDKDILPNITSALNDATDGDVILLPQGRFMISGRIYLKKKISFVGYGIWDEANKTGTLLYRDPNASDNDLKNNNAMTMFYVDPQTDETFDIAFSGFTIRGKQPSLKAGDGLSTLADNGIYLRFVNGFRISHMRFEYFGESAVHVVHRDSIAHGLIDHCEFYFNVKDPNGEQGNKGLGLGYGVVMYSDNQVWLDDPRFGTDNFIFIEDNFFEFHRHSVAAGGGALYVARYNVVKNNLVASGIDAHESYGAPSGGNRFATRAVEIYENTIINTVYRDFTPINPGDEKDVKLVPIEGIGIRGGEAVVHHNTIKGYLYGGRIVDHSFNASKPVVYPLPYQPGYDSGLKLGPNHSGTDPANGEGDLFYWENDFTPHHFDNSNGWYNSVDFYNENPAPKGPFKEGRDYHLVKLPGYVVFVYPHPRQGSLKDLACETDLNDDGQTNASDLSILLDSFGKTCSTSCPTDFNKDGVTNMEDLLMLENKMGPGCTVKSEVNEIFLYPNPAIDLLNFQLSDSRGQKVGVQLLDMYGKFVIKNMKAVADPYAPIRLELTSIQPGIYVLKVTNGSDIFLRKFVKVNNNKS
ncbi:MAG: T9SS type A sorting domain-containing protein [Flavobacteriales bacterium]|nr:T9SS type A sorting domain-containing protein [Flavobacteriales bacterium]